jgi:hypothetical protein
MSDKRQFSTFYARADQSVVTASIRDLRHMLNDTLDGLGPDAASARPIRQIRDGIHEYLTAVERAPQEPDHVLFAPALRDLRMFAPALRDLRMVIRGVAVEVAEKYEPGVAAKLVEAMDQAEADADPQTRRLYEDPIAGFKAFHDL